MDKSSGLPSDLSRLLYACLLIGEPPKDPDIQRGLRDGFVDDQGKLLGNLRAQGNKNVTLWEEGKESRKGTCPFRPLPVEPIVGPFHLVTEQFDDVCNLAILATSKGFEFFVRKQELELLRHGPIRRPLLYEVDAKDGVAYWTFDRRDLFPDEDE